MILNTYYNFWKIYNQINSAIRSLWIKFNNNLTPLICTVLSLTSLKSCHWHVIEIWLEMINAFNQTVCHYTKNYSYLRNLMVVYGFEMSIAALAPLIINCCLSSKTAGCVFTIFHDLNLEKNNNIVMFLLNISRKKLKLYYLAHFQIVWSRSRQKTTKQSFQIVWNEWTIQVGKHNSDWSSDKM